MDYTKPDFERVCWHKCGVVYPRLGQAVMMLFADKTVVLAIYDGFVNWIPGPVRWARVPVGPEGFDGRKEQAEVRAFRALSDRPEVEAAETVIGL